jgi:hypothetical protein
MSPSQIRIVFIIVACVILGWLTAPFWGGVPRADLPVSPAPSLFDAEQASRITTEFVTRNPRRVLGSIEARQATGYIREFLKREGYQLMPPAYFDATIAGRKQAGNNIVAYRAGTIPGTLALVAHYDTTRTTFQGAMDDGAGVGVMLELARVFGQNPLRHGLLIIASDGEEWGMLGAADFCATYPAKKQIAAALSLDYVASGDLAELQLATDGQRRGFTPPWLRRIALSAAATQGLPVVMPQGLREYAERAIALSLSDQGPFLHAGIPAINLGSESADKAREREIYHSQNDTIENLKPASLGIFGRAAERILRSLDESPAQPDGAHDAFRLSGDTYISGWAITLLQCLTFLPFAAMTGFGWQQLGKSLRATALLREVAFFIAWMTPFGFALSLILFCRLMRLLPRNSFYPGPLKDPMLIPAWGLVAGLFAAALALGVGLHLLARYSTRGLPRSFGESKIVLMTLLLVTVILALWHSLYWASSFLTLPALIWSAVGRGNGAAARLAGALAIPAAGAALYALTLVAGSHLGTGIDVLWYAVLGLSNGMLQWQGYFLAAGAIVIGLRLFSLQLSRN